MGVMSVDYLILQSSDSQPRNGGGENIFLSPITPAQFTAALDSATGNNSNLTQTPSNSVITTEMFNQAMQQVFANVTSGMPSPDGLRGSLVCNFCLFPINFK